MPEASSSGYFDLQVNGYGGVDFNVDELTAEQLNRACERLAADGVDRILATVITDSLDAMAKRIGAIVSLRARDKLVERMIAGIHIEGPFINETTGYRGAHPLDAVRPATRDAMKMLLDAGGGLVRLVTLAPERDPDLHVTTMLTKAGVVVSAGHCDPTLDQLEAAADAGLSMFTHVGNGCPMHGMHRHDNIIQRALSLSDRIWMCFIADGFHVPFVALKNYLRAAGLDRCIVVTDAIAPAGLGPGRYTLGRWELLIGADMVARAPDGSHFVGSAISMPESTRRLRDELGLSEAQRDQLTRINPGLAIPAAHRL
jgi:N-acetylglucosamine-6-phosphate deacetylase